MITAIRLLLPTVFAASFVLAIPVAARADILCSVRIAGGNTSYLNQTYYGEDGRETHRNGSWKYKEGPDSTPEAPTDVVAAARQYVDAAARYYFATQGGRDERLKVIEHTCQLWPSRAGGIPSRAAVEQAGLLEADGWREKREFFATIGASINDAVQHLSPPLKSYNRDELTNNGVHTMDDLIRYLNIGP